MIKAQVSLSGSASEGKAQYFLMRMWNKFHYLAVFPFMSWAFIKKVRRKNNVLFDYARIYATWIQRISSWSHQSTPSVYKVQQLLKTLICICLFLWLDCSTYQHSLPAITHSMSRFILWLIIDSSSALAL